jgi:hypothetical protein
MSGEWIGVVLITALLVILMAYSVSQAFRGRRPRRTSDGEEHSAGQEQPGRTAGRKAA